MAQIFLVTGGLGYIGFHNVVKLIKKRYTVIIIDNVNNSEKFILDRIETIDRIRLVFYEKDLCDCAAFQEIFTKHAIDLVIHFDAFKSVNESVKKPLKYFKNNLVPLINGLRAVQDNGIKNLIFSSSATVYGQPKKLPAIQQTSFQKALLAYVGKNK